MTDGMTDIITGAIIMAFLVITGFCIYMVAGHKACLDIKHVECELVWVPKHGDRHD
jgi:hypothetical protein